jgi:hypothetical protein
MTNQLSLEEAHSVLRDVQSYCESLALEHSDLQIVIGVCEGAASVVSLAMEDVAWPPETMDVSLTDGDVDCYELDTSFFAASCYSGGPVWVPGSSAAKREQFWRWWLTEAVPTAWHSQPVG